MALSQTIDYQTYMGDLKVVVGHFVLTGVTTGELNLSAYFDGNIISVVLGEQQHVTTPASQTANIIMDETFPLASGTAVTINASSGAKATFVAYGKGA